MRLIRTLLNISATLFSLTLVAFTATAADIRVQVSELKNSDGILLVILWEEDDKGFPRPDGNQNLVHQVTSATEPNVVFKDVEPGTYAISVIHNEKGTHENPKPEQSRPPKFGIGLSNNPKIGFFNRPNFKKASFELTEDTDQEIKMFYFKK